MKFQKTAQLSVAAGIGCITYSLWAGVNLNYLVFNQLRVSLPSSLINTFTDNIYVPALVVITLVIGLNLYYSDGTYQIDVN